MSVIMETGHEFRQLDRADRIQQGNDAMSRFVALMNTVYDLAPLSSFCGVNPGFEVVDCSGTQEDFQGTDIRLGPDGPRIQDKRRLSGRDIGIEFCRMYLFWSHARHYIVLDGGRDIYQIPFKWIDLNMQFGGYKVIRDWDGTKTISDFWVLHPQGSNDTMWLRSQAVKSYASACLDRWRHICTDGSDVYKKMMKVFLDNTTRSFRDELCTNFDIKAIKEASDEKWVCCGDDGQMSPIAKTICYLPFDLLVEGRDYVICRRR